MQQCYFIQVCNPSSYLITQHTIEIYDTLPQFSRGYYDIDHRPRKKVKIDAQAVSWRSCRVDRRDRSMNGGSGESGFWSLDICSGKRKRALSFLVSSLALMKVGDLAQSIVSMNERANRTDDTTKKRKKKKKKDVRSVRRGSVRATLSICPQ